MAGGSTGTRTTRETERCPSPLVMSGNATLPIIFLYRDEGEDRRFRADERSAACDEKCVQIVQFGEPQLPPGTRPAVWPLFRPIKELSRMARSGHCPARAPGYRRSFAPPETAETVVGLCPPGVSCAYFTDIVGRCDRSKSPSSQLFFVMLGLGHGLTGTA